MSSGIALGEDQGKFRAYYSEMFKRTLYMCVEVNKGKD